jgi:hypothetical protein
MTSNKVIFPDHSCVQTVLRILLDTLFLHRVSIPDDPTEPARVAFLIRHMSRLQDFAAKRLVSNQDIARIELMYRAVDLQMPTIIDTLMHTTSTSAFFSHRRHIYRSSDRDDYSPRFIRFEDVYPAAAERPQWVVTGDQVVPGCSCCA